MFFPKYRLRFMRHLSCMKCNISTVCFFFKKKRKKKKENRKQNNNNNKRIETQKKKKRNRKRKKNTLTENYLYEKWSFTLHLQDVILRSGLAKCHDVNKLLQLTLQNKLLELPSEILQCVLGFFWQMFS